MKEKVSIPIDETETIINYSSSVEWAEVYTTDKTIMKRFEKFTKEHPDYSKLVNEDKYSMTFSVHPKCASVYPKAPRKIEFTEEQREILRERLAAIRQK